MVKNSSETIVREAISILGSNKKLAERMNKHSSLISRYARGQVHPKPDFLLECLNIIESKKKYEMFQTVTDDLLEDMHRDVIGAINSLSTTEDQNLIQAIFDILVVGQKLTR
ncbi:MAG: hypothetical protein P8X74_21125 [Reinekea sp.]